ncbi:hypothetical protein BGC07_03145 [Piscirickettsia litoralis]|uniref:Chemotaxis protein n=2 Tax=Piscirickettsia litoralis TaxID=1891921 RepID=A0ABX2ZZV2_9GAMM|nr:hypothetical protein BGC07_03145 [Piscirickettsia litoralis]
MLANGINQIISTTKGISNDANRVLAALAKGKLNETIEKDYNGEFKRLKESANTTISQLQETVTGIKDDSGIVTSKAQDLAKNNAELNKSAQNQASTLEEIRISLENINGAVKENAGKLSEAASLSDQANNKASTGNELAKRTVAAMDEINQSSQKVQEITAVINDIAFQTNLLALNAAVEAARAGEQGRGFAVVASEVRTLSERSSNSAKEIQDLVDEAMVHVNNGQKMVNSSSEALEEITESVQSITQLVQELATSGNQQAVGINEIQEAVSDISQLTQDNAQKVSSQNEASMEISKRLGDMNIAISFFDIKN